MSATSGSGIGSFENGVKDFTGTAVDSGSKQSGDCCSQRMVNIYTIRGNLKDYRGESIAEDREAH